MRLQRLCSSRQLEFAAGFAILLQKAAQTHPAARMQSPSAPPAGSLWFSESLCAHQETLCHATGFHIPSPPQASKSVTHQFQTVTFHSQPILGAAGFVTHGDAGRREGRARLNEAKAARSLPHAGMSLLHFRSTQFGTCWRIPLTNVQSVNQQVETKGEPVANDIDQVHLPISTRFLISDLPRPTCRQFRHTPMTGTRTARPEPLEQPSGAGGGTPG